MARLTEHRSPARQQAVDVARHTMTQTSKISVDKLITGDSFTNFIKSVRDFCDFIEIDTNEGSNLFLKFVQIHLQTLYLTGQKLQSVDLLHNKEFNDLLTKEDLQKILNTLSDKLNNNRFYWHVFDPTNEDDTEPVCGDLLDDLGDIYKDLKNALVLFDKGGPAEIGHAIWDFEWGFNNHWGDHCINATYALHYFIQRST